MLINKETQLILELLEDFGIFTFAGATKAKFYTANNKESFKEARTTKFNNSGLVNKNFMQASTIKDNKDIAGSKSNSLKNNLLENNSPINDLLKKDLTEEDTVFTTKDLESENKSLEKANSLDEVRQILNNFKECSLAKMATNTVFGVGNQKADLLMIGEAPGAEEDLKGEPFVGRSGQLLTKALASVKIQRHNIFITNSVFWRPPGNRNPTSHEVALCKPFLQKIISLIKPKIILIVGKVAATALLEEDTAIGKLRGKWLSKNWGSNTAIVPDIKVRVIYHPAYLLRNPKQKKVFWFDLIEISNKIEELKLNV